MTQREREAERRRVIEKGFLAFRPAGFLAIAEQALKRSWRFWRQKRFNRRLFVDVNGGAAHDATVKLGILC